MASIIPIAIIFHRKIQENTKYALRFQFKICRRFKLAAYRLSRGSKVRTVPNYCIFFPANLLSFILMENII